MTRFFPSLHAFGDFYDAFSSLSGFIFIAVQLCGDPAGQEVQLTAASN